MIKFLLTEAFKILKNVTSPLGMPFYDKVPYDYEYRSYISVLLSSLYLCHLILKGMIRRHKLLIFFLLCS